MPTKKNENLTLWESVETSDEQYLKAFYTKDNTKLTNVDPHSQLKRATELWGPYGKSWGLRDLKFQQFTDGTETTIMLHAKFWLLGMVSEEPPLDVEFEVTVDLPLRHGKDVFKSLLTQARSKALSMLGFNADVYLGEFNDLPTPEQDETKDRALLAIQNAQSCSEVQLLRELLHRRSLEGTLAQDQYEILVSHCSDKEADLLNGTDANPEDVAVAP